MGYLVVWKIYVSGALALLFIPAVLRNLSLRNILLGITGVLYCCSDILINPYPIAGILLFGVGHIVLLVNMIIHWPPVPRRFIIFLVITAIFLTAAHFISTSVEKVAPFALPCVIYGIILVATVLKTSSDSPLLFSAMLVFLASDILLIFNFTMDTSRFLKILGLVVYYISVGMLILSVIFAPKPGNSANPPKH